jgi:hypothetical protein
MGFALNYALNPASIDKYTVARLPATPPSPEFHDQVVMLTCRGPYAAGRYSLGNLIVPEPGQPWARPESPIGDLPSALQSAGFLVVDPQCHPTLPPEVSALFHRPFGRDSAALYVRKLPQNQ